MYLCKLLPIASLAQHLVWHLGSTCAGTLSVTATGPVHCRWLRSQQWPQATDHNGHRPRKAPKYPASAVSGVGAIPPSTGPAFRCLAERPAAWHDFGYAGAEKVWCCVPARVERLQGAPWVSADRNLGWPWLCFGHTYPVGAGCWQVHCGRAGRVGCPAPSFGHRPSDQRHCSSVHGPTGHRPSSSTGTSGTAHVHSLN